MRFRGSLAARVSLLAAVAVGLSIALLESVAYLGVRHQLVSALDEQLLERASEMSGDVSVAALLSQDLPPWIFGASDARIAIVDASVPDDPFDRPSPTATARLPLGDPELAVARSQSSYSVRTITNADGSFRVMAVPNGGDQALVLAQSLRPTEKTLGQLGVILFLAGCVGVGAAALAGWVVARNGLRPVRTLSDAAEEIARTEDLRPIAVQGEDEIARLATAFNSMLVALSASRDRQRQLVADAGHELRTPLTSLRTNLDLLAQADRRGGLTAEQRAELMDDVRFQIDELTTLIGDLTELARDEPIHAHLEPLDLAEVVERAVERARRRGHEVDFALDLQPSPVDGEPASLERAVLNLLDNAVKWSPTGGTVVVELRHGTLSVTDEGPGIAEEDLPHVFERFYRSRESRTMPGSGLGLAIVRNVAERHGGTVRAGRAPGGGAAFWLTVPERRGPDDHADEQADRVDTGGADGDQQETGPAQGALRAGSA